MRWRKMQISVLMIWKGMGIFDVFLLLSFSLFSESLNAIKNIDLH